MTKNIIIKTSVQKQFDSFMAHGRVLFFSAPCGFGRQYWRTHCYAVGTCCGKVRQTQTAQSHRQRRIGTFC